LPWPLLTAETLRLATRRALRRPELSRRAAELGAEAAHNSGPARAADLVEQFARREAARR